MAQIRQLGWIGIAIGLALFFAGFCVGAFVDNVVMTKAFNARSEALGVRADELNSSSSRVLTRVLKDIGRDVKAINAIIDKRQPATE